MGVAIWESLNALIKAFFFRRANRGGGNKGYSGVGRLLQRCLMWLCNLTDGMLTDYASFRDNGTDISEDTITDNHEHDIR
eukprot:scaffold203374_cov56-Attheya_sp.AAC.1